MVSKAKLYTKLDLLEAELKEIIIPHLQNAAEGNNDYVFCAKPFSSVSELKSKTDLLTQDCIDIGSQIINLRQKLGESSDGTIAERICWYCRKWNSSEHRDKDSALSLAKQFLAEIVEAELS